MNTIHNYPLHKLHTLLLGTLVLLCSLLAGGCASSGDARLTNPQQPGPAVGHVVGAVTGAVVGNVAGAVVGAGEGFVSQSAEVFNTDRRVVRQWRTIQTNDGRVIQIPVEIEVDKNGIPLNNQY